MATKKKITETTPLIYDGATDGVVVGPLPSGRTVTAYRGETIQFTQDDARALSGHPEWAPEPVTTLEVN